MNDMSLIRDAQGQPLFTMNLYQNITERKQAEKALQESEERLSAVVNYSPAKIHIKDAEGRYVLINPIAEKLFAVTDKEARGKTTHEIFARSIRSSPR